MLRLAPAAGADGGEVVEREEAVEEAGEEAGLEGLRGAAAVGARARREGWAGGFSTYALRRSAKVRGGSRSANKLFLAFDEDNPEN